MKHFLIMTSFAALAAVVLGIVAKDNQRERMVYGVKVFGEFLAIGLVLGWILYFLPF